MRRPEQRAADVGHRSSRCIVCGEDRGRTVDRRTDFEIRCCPCGGVYLAPEPGADAVDPTDDPHPDSFYELSAPRKLRWLRRFHSGGKLLEVGCGRPFFLRAARALGYEIAGIEAHPERAAFVASSLGIEVEHALVERSNWPSQSCDIVYHCDLLSHFPDPVAALHSMARLLRPEGSLFFEVGLVGNLQPLWYRRMPDHSFPRHRWFFDDVALGRLLERAGLRVVRLKRFGLLPQLAFYHAVGPLFRGMRAIARLVPRGRSATASPKPGITTSTSTPPRERPLEGRINDFLRFGVGAFAPSFGPATAFVLARRT